VNAIAVHGRIGAIVSTTAASLSRIAWRCLRGNDGAGQAAVVLLRKKPSP
jgi:hypothetical protein